RRGPDRGPRSAHARAGRALRHRARGSKGLRQRERSGEGAGAQPQRALSKAANLGDQGLRMSGAIRHEWGIGALALCAGLPAVVVSLILLFSADLTPKVSVTLAALILLFWLCLALAIPGRVARPLRRLSSVLGSFREGDFSIRARDAGNKGAVGLASLELNALGDLLREQRLGAFEASALLAKVVAEIDVAVFACDAS